MAEPVEEVRDRRDAAATVDPVTREASLQRVILLREAELIVEDLLSDGPPRPDFFALVTPEAAAERKAIKDAAVATLASFCEGRQPRECLLAEVEALFITVPELNTWTKWDGALGQAASRRKVAIPLAEAGSLTEAEQIAGGMGPSFDRNEALDEVALLLARDRQVVRAFKLLEAVDEPDQLADAISAFLGPPSAPDERAVTLDGSTERPAALAAVKRVAELADCLADADQREAGLSGAATLYLRLSEVEAATAVNEKVRAGWSDRQWLCQLSLAQMTAGAFAEAERLAERIVGADPEWELPFASLAAGLAAAGQFDEARLVAGRLPTLEGQASSLVMIATAFASIDPHVSAASLAEAEALATSIIDPDDRVSALGRVEAALAEIGAGDRSEAQARQIVGLGAGPEANSLALRSIASAL